MHSKAPLGEVGDRVKNNFPDGIDDISSVVDVPMIRLSKFIEIATINNKYLSP